MSHILVLHSLDLSCTPSVQVHSPQAVVMNARDNEDEIMMQKHKCVHTQSPIIISYATCYISLPIHYVYVCIHTCIVVIQTVKLYTYYKHCICCYQFC